jgi:hypothetical protein
MKISLVYWQSSWSRPRAQWSSARDYNLHLLLQALSKLFVKSFQGLGQIDGSHLNSRPQYRSFNPGKSLPPLVAL